MTESVQMDFGRGEDGVRFIVCVREHQSGVCQRNRLQNVEFGYDVDPSDCQFETSQADNQRRMIDLAVGAEAL